MEPVYLKPSSSSSRNEEDHEWKCYRNCVLRQSMLHNFHNFKRSDVPERFMEWCGGEWVEFFGDVLSRVISAFSNRIPMFQIEVQGNLFIFDFYRMLKIEVGTTGLQRSIAWIDVKGNCFFPKFFIDESLLDHDDDEHEQEHQQEQEQEQEQDDEHSSNGTISKIEIEIKIDDHIIDNDKINNKNKNISNGKRKRVCDEEDTAASFRNSENGDGNRKQQCLESLQKLRWPNVRLVSEGERTFGVVKDLFMNGMKIVHPGVQITAIRQFVHTGPIEKGRWEAFHNQIQNTQGTCGGVACSNTALAWHGTSKKLVFDILAHGFRQQTNASHAFGVYLSPVRFPHISDAFAQADDDGEKHVVLCQVILGNVVKGSQQYYQSGVALDTGADNLVNPRCYVVATTNMNTHILPEHVVSYKCSDCKPGTKEGDELMKWIPNGPISAKLFFSKLSALLPAAKLEKLKALCMSFKAGLMAKDLFIRQLRSTVGNEMLYSAMAGSQVSN